MSRIVYLFGAGASYGKRDPNSKDYIVEGLPIVSEFPIQIDRLIAKIQSGSTESKSQFKAESQDVTKLIDELRWLKETSESHQTVDTYAKKLWVTDNKQYLKLKKVLSAFLTLEQLYNKPDSRYDAFFANIIGSIYNKLPEDVTVLSWNYDFQFEIAHAAYSKRESINAIWEDLKIRGKTTKESIDEKDGFSIFKLNGTALSFEDRGFRSKFYDPLFERRGTSELSFVKWAYLTNATNVRNALSFAWEGTDSGFYENIETKVSDAEILVVIGYSFPYFNREVDRKIIQSMSNLQKVYIQDPSCEDVKESFEATLSDMQLYDLDKGTLKIVLKKSTQQFLIPNEM